jgi:ADP-heptose:LPS heptosyltransferase
VTTLTFNRFWLKGSQLVRWRMRGLLRLLPMRAQGASAAPGPAAVPERYRIAYMFTGTYGDFVQILRPLNRLAAAFPDAEILLFGGDRYAWEFSSELPANLRIARPLDPFRWFKHPVDLMVTNCVGVYRVRFDFAARFCARRAYGFRHAHETRRGGYADTIPLVPEIRSFAEENMRLLDMVGAPSFFNPVRKEESPETAKPSDALFPEEPPVPAWGEGKILFHIGSAGLKKDFGPKVYARLVLSILTRLEGRAVEVVMGPGDEDIAHEVRTRTGFVPQAFPLSRLIRIMRSFEGTVLCFNSFPAHICQYLGRPAIVMHRNSIPYGYDCAPLHKQVVLKAEKGWDLEEVWDALESESF